jgi:hypothetical protein
MERRVSLRQAQGRLSPAGLPDRNEPLRFPVIQLRIYFPRISVFIALMLS